VKWKKEKKKRKKIVLRHVSFSTVERTARSLNFMLAFSRIMSITFLHCVREKQKQN